MVDESTSRGGGGLFERLVDAWRLHLRVYDEVSIDGGANGQAFLIVLLAGLLNGIALIPRLGGLGVWAGIGAAILGWPLWAGTVLLIARVLGHRCGDRSLIRTLGFANAPGMFLVFGVVRVIGPLIRIAVVCWLLAATVLAVQAVFQVARRRALLISLVAFGLYLILGIISARFAGA